MPYWQLYYHIVWTTKKRLPLITEALEPKLYQYLRRKAKEDDAILHAVGGIVEHVHMAVSIPPKIAVAKFVADIKGASSYWVTNVLKHDEFFAWQRGYGVLSFSKPALPSVVKYVLNQKEHHRQGTLNEEMEKTDEENESA